MNKKDKGLDCYLKLSYMTNYVILSLMYDTILFFDQFS